MPSSWPSGINHLASRLALLALFALVLMGLPRMASASSGVSCTLGPVAKTFGGSNWLVYGCEDGRSVVVVSVPGSPAAPFYFIMTPGTRGVDLHGEGTGKQSASAAAFRELRALDQTGVAVLFEEAKARARTSQRAGPKSK